MTENCLGVETCTDCSISNINSPECGDGDGDADGDGGGAKKQKKVQQNIYPLFLKKIISDSDDSIIIIIGGLGDDAHTVVKE